MQLKIGDKITITIEVEVVGEDRICYEVMADGIPFIFAVKKDDLC